VIPDLPATKFFQALDVPIPTGDTTPKPVTTTLRLFDISRKSALDGADYIEFI
jgi:hypothetical protein